MVKDPYIFKIKSVKVLYYNVIFYMFSLVMKSIIISSDVIFKFLDSSWVISDFKMKFPLNFFNVEKIILSYS